MTKKETFGHVSAISIFAVQKILGHKYIDTTLRYARTYNFTVAREYELVLEVLPKLDE